MMSNIDLLWQMYSTLFRDIDRTLAVLEDGNIPKAKEILQQTPLKAVELSLSEERAVNELAQHPEEAQ